jgi:AcrR family transcriptional regulator
VAERRGPDAVLGDRAQQTRELILQTCQQLFLKLGYRGTRIENITTACGISRAGFYTYFVSKQEVFVALGTTTYREITKVVARLGALPDPCSRSELQGWVEGYFEFMDRHGTFLLSSEQAGPEDPELLATIRSLQLRTARRLGRLIHTRRGRPGDDAAVGLAVTALLDQSWYLCNGMELPIDQARVVSATTDLLATYLAEGMIQDNSFNH